MLSLKVFFQSSAGDFSSVIFSVIVHPHLGAEKTMRPWIHGRWKPQFGFFCKLGGGSRMFQTTCQRIEDEYAFYETCCDMIRFGWIWWNRSNSCFEVMWNRISHDLTYAMISLLGRHLKYFFDSHDFFKHVNVMDLHTLTSGRCHISLSPPRISFEVGGSIEKGVSVYNCLGKFIATKPPRSPQIVVKSKGIIPQHALNSGGNLPIIAGYCHV